MANTVTNTNNLSLRSILEKDKLTGANFLDWERNLMIVLRHERKWYVLEEPLGEAPPANATANVRNAYRKHSDDLLDVGCLMLATMSPDLQTGLMNTNAYDMIRQLRDMFQTQARTERYDATRALNACKMAKGTSVSDHVMKMKRHIDHLERLGQPVPLQLATDTQLNSLTEDYKQFVINYNMNNMEKKIAELHSMLKTAELSMGTGTKTKDVLMVGDGGAKRKRRHGNTGKGKSQSQASQSVTKVENNDERKGKGKKVKPNKARTENRCFICHELGHWRQNCPKRHKAGNNASEPWFKGFGHSLVSVELVGESVNQGTTGEVKTKIVSMGENLVENSLACPCWLSLRGSKHDSHMSTIEWRQSWPIGPAVQEERKADSRGRQVTKTLRLVSSCSLRSRRTRDQHSLDSCGRGCILHQLLFRGREVSLRVEPAMDDGKIWWDLRVRLRMEKQDRRKKLWIANVVEDALRIRMHRVPFGIPLRRMSEITSLANMFKQLQNEAVKRIVGTSIYHWLKFDNDKFHANSGKPQYERRYKRRWLIFNLQEEVGRGTRVLDEIVEFVSCGFVVYLNPVRFEITVFLISVRYEDCTKSQHREDQNFSLGSFQKIRPPGFVDPKFPDHVYKLNKALYGLKQASRAWYDTLSTFILSKGFEHGKIDSTLFLKKYPKHILLVQIYVDDIIFGSTNPKLCEKFELLMKTEYKMSMMGELTYFLGLQIKQSKKGIFINQGKYVLDMLKKFDLTSCTPMKTPMAPPLSLDKDSKGKPVDVTLYRGMIGSLLYLTASRPDIMYSTCLCARYQAEPKESHLTAVKRIFIYLKGTPNLGLWYSKDSGFDLTAYSDSDFAGCKIDRKSTTGGCHLLGGKLVSWTSKKQNSVSTSTAEAEYVAAGICCAQVLWLRNQL
ncbi:hypothetical protein OSB04_015975 [Centaurea solstitialis]|uniref:CCHC-type domain-containing protein n=1 Tax=Centaurea solstitialis TaxID=347529 RepID=A0AA38WH07_9ASTR|nr:hypothetical protein OSB04_015975 [Centaurea solstitialis]